VGIALAGQATYAAWAASPGSEPADNDVSLTIYGGMPYFGLSDVSKTGTNGSSTLYRLREGIERFFITDINNPAASAKAQSVIPVMMDVVASGYSDFDPAASGGQVKFNHMPGGGNVLYMDGHVEFKKYIGPRPAGMLEYQDYGNFPYYQFFADALGQSGSGGDAWFPDELRPAR
jgi:prepilin-type processing-associated H-X9-DG protein